MNSLTFPYRSRLRFASLLSTATVSTLMLTGCVGEPSIVTKALIAAGAKSSRGAATVSAVSPSAGSVSGGVVTLTGSGLANVSSVEIGGQAATVMAASETSVTVAVPAARYFVAGAVPIVVTETPGTAVATGGATYDYQVLTPVDRQLSYAMTHWKDYNSHEWGDLNPIGGDCANFVSQTLIARGWVMNDEWYNKNAADEWSPAWGYVPSMNRYFSDNAADLGLTEYSFDQRDKVKVGDIVMFDWDDDDSLDHVQIVSAVEKTDGRIAIKMSGHNDDADYLDLDEVITVTNPGAVGHFWSLSE